MQIKTVVVMLLSTFVSAGDDPPRPDPRQPVNYMEWINDAYSKGIKKNAAEKYLASIDAYVESDPARSIISAPGGSEWSKRDLETIREWTEANESCLTVFIEATALRRCFFELDPTAASLVEVEVPWDGSIRNIARLLATRARLRLSEGNVPGAMNDWVAVRRAAQHMSLQPNVIDYLVSIAIAAMSYRVLADIPRRASGAVAYDAILSKVKRYDRPIVLRPIRQLETERLSNWDVLQKYASDTDGDGLLDQVHLGEVLDARIDPISIEAATKDVDEAFELCKQIFTPDYATARKRAADFERDLSLRKPSVIGIMLPSLSRIALLQRRAATDRNGTRLVLHIHAFRSANGRWPKDLKEATQGAASAIRLDPFSGQDVIYRIVNGKPLLYSVGTDGDDDGGKRATNGKRWADDGDTVFWP